MTDRPAPARLLSLRLHGFKSFAERTAVEFGAGVSAVVGPNGSGKSNLADGLRWALGEQGRALRSRKAEDVIWAGSENRPAQGMADVTLVLDNADGLLPVDFQVLELGRRLYRSGENDYLLNRQRVRLRDLVDLLDAAHLADNAFLFIGQGMVDQALALRPEERRPLFEEVAGVRRHDRRRRKAEEQLAESEGNLARVEDILVELRPQARRLASQAQQQASRATAGQELVEALLLTAHARWHSAHARARNAARQRDAAARQADATMAALASAEAQASSLAAELAARAVDESDRRVAHDAARVRLTELQVTAARLTAELEALERDRSRLVLERDAATTDAESHRRILAEPPPGRDHELERALGEAERGLADALGEVGALRSQHRARGEEAAALRRAALATEAERETASRRLTEVEQRAADERERAADLARRRDELENARTSRLADMAAAAEAERSAAAERETRHRAADQLDVASRTATDRLAGGAAALGEARGRLESLEARIAEQEERGIARAARRQGGRRVDEDLVVDPAWLPAVEAALGAATRAYVVGPSAAGRLAGERGTLAIVDDGAAAAADAASDLVLRRFRDRVAASGGGILEDAVRRDGVGVARRLLARVAWLPDLATCLELQPEAPAGWALVPRDGSATVGHVVVELGSPDPTLERRTESERLRLEVARLDAMLSDLQAAADAAGASAIAAREALDQARAEEARAAAATRGTVDAERATARELEAVTREAAWHEAQAALIDDEVRRLRAAVEGLGVGDGAVAATDAGDLGPDDAAALAAWEARAAELRVRRDRLLAEATAAEATRRWSENRRSRAEATIALGEDRIRAADEGLARLSDRLDRLVEEQAAIGRDIAAAENREAEARRELEALLAADAATRDQLTAAERAAAMARETLRSANERLRVADHEDLEARLGLDSLRDGLLVELGGLGDIGLAIAVGEAAEAAQATGSPAADEASAVLATHVDALAGGWAEALPTQEPPTPGRLATLRRRYHELGGADADAVGAYEELQARLDALEGQERDLRAAIDRTRELIVELDTMIADQFRTTFAALESAFERRFERLFDGGSARLSLTDPGDLAATGIEIVARPPGKKAQALSMLSGGERALTAVALLFAMLEVRPVPFCVLDEVDAALDEANIGRFAESLRDLATRTQFIVITHNRGTIESADALYGVTVGDDSVSRVISLRLDEANALADRRREELAPAG
ncbi:MAG: chromosome segregation protein SMC [Chloroflexota bacterium]